MKNDNDQNNLRDALNQLPDYDPPERLWSAISEDLAAKELTEAVADLPEYTPPPAVWERIETVLAAEAETKSVVRLLNLQRWAAAAVVLLLCGAFWLVNRGFDSLAGSNALEYAEETVDDALLERSDEMNDDAAYAEILAMCELQGYACTQTVFQSLKNELDELTQARDMLLEAIGDYGTDAELLRELKEIELLRTDLLKQLAAQVA